ncbi:translation initiation factor IF-3 [Hymenobacter sp. ISL-91]|nr:translation initiation factor IF-3 [Hymenobacter sp. ISL-91]
MATPNRRYIPRAQVEEPFKINHKITAREVRLVGDNVEQGIYTTDQARRMAQDQNLDLVEISPTASPPVCRVIDYSKFKYEQKKKTRELKAKQTKVVIKEIRFGPNTDDHDFAFKLKHAQEFLKEGAKIKAYVHFVGRSIVFKERGEILLLKFAQALEDLAKVEQLPKLEGKRMFLYLAPKVVAPPKKVAPKEADKAKSTDKAAKTAAPAPVAKAKETASVETDAADQAAE